MKETIIETLKRLERTIAKQAVELAELRQALADVRVILNAPYTDSHKTVCAIAARLDNLPTGGGGE